jgi:broad specificity phosphatase PhoE
MVIKDNLFILPCLQEKRVQNEAEQYGSIITSYNNIPNLPVSSSNYNKIWSGKNINFLKEKGDQRDSILPLNDLMGKYLFKPKGSCKNILTIDKWRMYGLFLLNTSNQNNKNITSFFITHHNRLRGLENEKHTEKSLYQIGRGVKDKYVGLKNYFGFSDSTLPLLPLIDSSVCGAYANNFCLRIEYTPQNNLDISISFPGYPDKGELSQQCQRFNCNNQSCYSQQEGGSSYNYCCQELMSNINTNIIHAALIGYNEGKKFISGVFSNSQKKITIYVVRHGNSLHNQPTDISGNLRLDSSLTPLGLYQAYLLGNRLKEMYPADFSLHNNIILCSSFLCRTQLTGLSILDAIFGYGNIPNKLKKDYILLLRNSLYRFYEGNKSEGIFFWKDESEQIKLDETFSPLEMNIESYIDFINFLDEINSKINNENQVLEQTSGKIKFKKSIKKRKKKKKKKTSKKNKKTYQKGGECSDSADFWSKLHLYI